MYFLHQLSGETRSCWQVDRVFPLNSFVAFKHAADIGPQVKCLLSLLEVRLLFIIIFLLRFAFFIEIKYFSIQTVVWRDLIILVFSGKIIVAYT